MILNATTFITPFKPIEMKFLVTLLLLTFTFTASAQFIKRAPATKDSAVNAQTKYLTFDVASRGITGIELTWIKSSGFAKGTAVIQRRIDTLSASSTGAWVTTGSTFTFTNGTDESYIWPITVNDGYRWRIKVVTVDSTQKLYLHGAMLRQ